MPDKLKLGDITRGEWETIKRRRLGLTQAEVAAKEGVDRLVVVRREKNIFPHPQCKQITITGPEWCFIMRVRKGSTQADIGKQMKLSSFWVREMEAGRQDCSRLMLFLGYLST